MVNVGKELLAVPFPEMVESLALGIANAQFELDQTGIRLAQMMSGKYERPNEDGTVEQVTSTIKFDGREFSLLELGFTPTFYQFVDTIIEVKMSITATHSAESRSSRTSTSASGKVSFGFFSGKASMQATTVSASYASKYSYSAEGSSLLRTKLVPVPPPAVLEERIRGMLDRDRTEAQEGQAKK